MASSPLSPDRLKRLVLHDSAHPVPLADVLIRLAPGDWMKLNRLADALQQVSQASVVHEFVVCQVLDAFITHVAIPTAKVHFVLSLLLQLHASLGIAVPEDLATRLQEFKGASKAAKLAKKLLAIEETANRSEYYIQFVEQRLVIAERWGNYIL